MSPATKAASGNGKLVIAFYCSDPIVATKAEACTINERPTYKMRQQGKLLQHLLAHIIRTLDVAVCLLSSRPGFLRSLRGRRLFGRCRRGWSRGLGRTFGQDLADQSGRHGRGQNRAISSLFDLEAIEERL